MTINKVENDTCNLQVVRGYDELNLRGLYGNKSQFLDASVNMMVNFAIPLISIDYSLNVEDLRQSIAIAPPSERDPFNVVIR